MRNKINLLPERQKVRRSVGVLTIALLILGTVLIAFLAGLYSFRRQAIIKTEERLDDITRTIALIKPDVDALMKVEARTKEIQKLREEVIALKDPHISPALMLAELKAKVPADAWLTSANVSASQTVTVDGVTYNYQGVARTVFALESTSMFKDLSVNSVTRTDEGYSVSFEDFVITGALERRR